MTINKPAKFESIVGDERVVFTPVMEDETPMIKFLRKKESDTASLYFRLTAFKARELSNWLTRYANWAESMPSQGGR